ncbi:MAG TPA: glycoside hydrolase family 76 protein [Thermomicrobiaceae bacterium]|nr:glycoside hydrolase family 76 protein [Thermomicrobiaceae bacterium]
MQRGFFLPRRKLYRATLPDDGHTSFLWPFSQAFAATLDLAELPAIAERLRPDVADRLDGLAHYWNGHGHPPAYDSAARSWFSAPSDQFTDDNAWVGLQLVRAHELTGEAAALDRARDILRFLIDNWDDDPSHPDPGGVFWVRAGWCRDRNTVSTAPAAILALRLHALAGDADALSWATRMYDWVRQALLAPNGLYWDHVDLAGTVERTQWSYNQGTMVGAGVLLAGATGDDAYREQAARTARAALAFYAEGDRLAGQEPAFNAIFLEHLLLLRASGVDLDLTLLRGYGEWLWESARDPGSGLVVLAPDRPIDLLQQAAASRICALLARSSGSR